MGSEETEWYQRVTQGRLGKAVARGTEGDKGIKGGLGKAVARGTEGDKGAPRGAESKGKVDIIRLMWKAAKPCETKGT